MKIPRYLQQEQFTDQSALVPQQQRIVSPLEVVGQGGAGILENIVQQDQQAYIASESAKALSKVNEVADQIQTDIDKGDILDSRSLEDSFKQRVNQSLDGMQLPSRVRRAIQPDMIQSMATIGIRLKHSLSLRRGEIEVDNLNQALDSFKRSAIEAQTPEELNQSIATIRQTVDKVEGTFLAPHQKYQFIQSTMDFIHTARADRMLNTPGADPATAMQYLESKKGEMTSAAYEAQRTAIENKIQDLNERHSFLDIDEALRMAKDDGSIPLSSVQQLIEQNKDQFNTTTLSYFQNKIDSIESERKADTKELVENLITRTMLTDPEKALRIAEEKKSVLGNVGYDDVVTRIAIAKNSQQKSDADRMRNTAQQLNESILGMRIERGEFDDLSDDQMKNFLESESVMNMTISPTAAGTLMDKWGRKLDKKAEDRIEIDKAQKKISAGIILDQKQTDLVYKTFTSINDPQSQNWMDQEVSFAAQTAKNIPTPWLDFTKSARLLSPTPDNMGTIDTAAEYVVKLSKENPGVSANLDKETLMLLPDYWDRAGKIPDMSPEKKAEVWANILRARDPQNKEMIDRITQTSEYGDIKDKHWKDAWKWYGKFAEDQKNTQAEWFRRDPSMPVELQLQWAKAFNDQLQATTGEDGISNFDRAAEYAYQQLFSQWGMTEVYGPLRWQYQPLDKFIRKTPFYPEDVKTFIDQEIKRDLQKNVTRPGDMLPSIGANYSFPDSGGMIDESRISLEYVPGSEKENPRSGFPDYLILIDGEAQPGSNPGEWFTINGDDLYQFLSDKKVDKDSSKLDNSKYWRAELNQLMRDTGLDQMGALSRAAEQIPD